MILFLVFVCVIILSIFSTIDPRNLTNHILEFVKNLVKLGLWTVAGSGWLISMLEKLNWFHLTDPITLVLLMWKWMGLFLRKNHLSRCWGWLSLLNWIGGSYIVSIAKRKLKPWFILWNFFLPRFLCVSINLSYGHALNAVVISGLVLLFATWNC